MTFCHLLIEGGGGEKLNVVRMQHCSLPETNRFQCFRHGETAVSPTPFPFKSPLKNKEMTFCHLLIEGGGGEI